MSSSRISVAKTIKLFIGGNFPRTESGRSFPIHLHNSKSIYAQACLASRKDLRMAVEAAQKALPIWSQKTAYNRSQILYRMAEMMEGKREEFSALLQKTQGFTAKQVEESIDQAIDSFIYFAGFADKFTQLVASVNPVSGPYHNFTSAEPVGVVGLICEDAFDFSNLIAHICSIVCSGNSTVVIVGKIGAAILSPLAEVFATSDLPGGTINLLSGDVDELYPHLGQHMEVHSIIDQGNDAKRMTDLQTMAIENMKRIVQKQKNTHSLEAILDFVEYKTVWHPIGL